MKTNQELIEELMGSCCQCGNNKPKSNTFCRACYFSLPKSNRRELYKQIGEGYAEAYEAAVTILKAKQ